MVKISCGLPISRLHLLHKQHQYVTWNNFLKIKVFLQHIYSAKTCIMKTSFSSAHFIRWYHSHQNSEVCFNKKWRAPVKEKFLWRSVPFLLKRCFSDESVFFLRNGIVFPKCWHFTQGKLFSLWNIGISQLFNFVSIRWQHWAATG